MPKIFDYSFLDNGTISISMLNTIANIYSYKSETKELISKYNSIFSELESIAKIQSVKNSNEIEGIITSEDRIHSIVNDKVKPLNHDEAEIAGYRDALNLIHTNYADLDFNEKNILDIHSIIMSIVSYEYGGKYKNEDNIIIEVDSLGRRQIRFMPTKASETKDAMEQLILAYIDARANANINQLLLIPCVILDFLCIHPFNDGNGRVSRLLSLLLLYKNGFDVGKYISFEEQINLHKSSYYESLKQSSDGWHDNSNDYMPFIKNFIETLFMCYSELGRRFTVLDGSKMTKRARIEATVINSMIPISKAEICKVLPDVSQTTVEAILAEMVKDGRIKKIGKGRATKYLRKEILL